jgi:choline dehydrogenase-like flavoprotein
MQALPDIEYDLVVAGSGFGGVMAALPAVLAGRRVLMLERGDWIRRSPDNWGPEGFFELTGAYSRETPFQVDAGEAPPSLGLLTSVGGASVFFGGVSLRLRERDFLPDREIDPAGTALWPYAYAGLEPYYARAEAILGVAGVAGEDPTEPPRSAPFPHRPGPLAPISSQVAEAARALGLRPFRLPLAINYTATAERHACESCNTCDGFACAVSAKNDLATTAIADLCRRGLDLRAGTVVTSLVVSGRSVTRVEAVDRMSGQRLSVRCRAVVVAAGALATPQILLGSGLDRLNPAGEHVGRYLMRHANAVVMGAFARQPAPDREFHKQLGIHDYYDGHPSVGAPAGKLGSIQQWGTPQTDYILRYIPRWQHAIAKVGMPHVTGFIVIAEDQPSGDNRVSLTTHTTAFGLRQAAIAHQYGARDHAARRALATAAASILRRAGALATFVRRIPTFSHALGTVRLGPDPALAPLDPSGAFRGLDNVYVTDASALPRSGGVNPSLTIAANALRTGDIIRDRL